jgi:hypothetical protein
MRRVQRLVVAACLPDSRFHDFRERSGASPALQSTLAGRGDRMPKQVMLVALALCGFAANSLLCRAALSEASIDYASFTAVRIIAGALVLAAIVVATCSGSPRTHGDWRAAAALFSCALAFAWESTSKSVLEAIREQLRTDVRRPR